MDIFGTANEIKQLDDRQLMQARPHIPDFLFATEMSRRDQMRKAYQADVANRKGKSTVMDDMEQRMQQQMQPQPQQPMQPQGPPQQQPMMQQGPPPQGDVGQMMAGGGMVRYADGGSPGPWREGYGAGAPAAAMPMPGILRAPRTLSEFRAKFGDTPSIGQYKSQAPELMGGQDYLSPIAAEMAGRKAASVVGKPSGWQALMRAGLAMAASRRPDAIGGIAEGLLSGLDGYSRDREAYRGDQVRQESVASQMLQQRAAMAEHQQAQALQQAQLAAQLQAVGGHERNTMNSGLMNVLTQDDAHQSQMALEQQREKANAELNGPYRDAQAEAKRAEAEQRQRSAAVWARYMKMANGDEAKAEQMMKRADAEARHFQEPRQYSPAEMLDARIIAAGIARGDDPEELRVRLLQGKNRAGIAEEKRNAAIVSRARALGIDKAFDIEEKQAILAEAERQVDSGTTSGRAKPAETPKPEQKGWLDWLKPSASAPPTAGGFKITGIEKVK